MNSSKKTKLSTLEDNLDALKDLVTEARNTYDQSHQTYSNLDTKLNFYFTLTTSIILLFVSFIEFPQNCNFIILYLFSLTLLILNLIFLISAYNPKEYKNIDLEKLNERYEEYNSHEEFLSKLAGTIAANNKSMQTNILIKARWLNISSWLIFISTILIILLNIIK